MPRGTTESPFSSPQGVQVHRRTSPTFGNHPGNTYVSGRDLRRGMEDPQDSSLRERETRAERVMAFAEAYGSSSDTIRRMAEEIDIPEESTSERSWASVMDSMTDPTGNRSVHFRGPSSLISEMQWIHDILSRFPAPADRSQAQQEEIITLLVEVAENENNNMDLF